MEMMTNPKAGEVLPAGSSILAAVWEGQSAYMYSEVCSSTNPICCISSILCAMTTDWLTWRFMVVSDVKYGKVFR